jgi:hypothetical protein
MKRVPCIAAAMAALMSLAASIGAQEVQQQNPPGQSRPEKKEQAQREEVKQEVGEAVDSIRIYSYERRQEAMAVARRSMDELDAQLDKMQAQSHAQWTAMSEAARSRSQRSAGTLRRQRNALSEWYGGMRQSSAAAWDEVKTGFIASYHELSTAMRQVRDDARKADGQDQDERQKPEQRR